jgi:collagenase-like PrtC family protease
MPQQVVARKPEIMSPAGYWPQLRAAIEAGADAVYFELFHSPDQDVKFRRKHFGNSISGSHRLPEDARLMTNLLHNGFRLGTLKFLNRFASQLVQQRRGEERSSTHI